MTHRPPTSRPFRALAIAALLAIASAAPARAGFQTSYTVTTDPGMPTVTNLMMFEGNPATGFGSATWAFEAPGDHLTTTLVNPFVLPEMPTRSILIGLIKGLPTDGSPEQEHVVLFMDDVAALWSNHIAWGTLFRHIREEEVIEAIHLATSGLPWETIQPGLDLLSGFLDGDATDGILGPGGASRSAWFETGSTFTVMSWSDGTIIGSGTSSVELVGAAVPEPSSLALAGLGVLGLLGYDRRRRRAAA